MPWSESAGVQTLLPAVAWMAAVMVAALGSRWAIAHANRNDLLDHPGERRSHAAPTPRGGGIGIAIACLLALLAIGHAAAQQIDA